VNKIKNFGVIRKKRFEIQISRVKIFSPVLVPPSRAANIIFQVAYIPYYLLFNQRFPEHIKIAYRSKAHQIYKTLLLQSTDMRESSSYIPTYKLLLVIQIMQNDHGNHYFY